MGCVVSFTPRPLVICVLKGLNGGPYALCSNICLNFIFSIPGERVRGFRWIGDWVCHSGLGALEKVKGILPKP